MPASVALYCMYCTLLTVTDGYRWHKGQGSRVLDTTCSGAPRPPSSLHVSLTLFGLLECPMLLGSFPDEAARTANDDDVWPLAEKKRNRALSPTRPHGLQMMMMFITIMMMMFITIFAKGQTMCAVSSELSSIYSTAQFPTRPHDHTPTRPKVHKDRLRSRAKASAAGSPPPPPCPPPPLA